MPWSDVEVEYIWAMRKTLRMYRNEPSVIRDLPGASCPCCLAIAPDTKETTVIETRIKTLRMLGIWCQFCAIIQAKPMNMRTDPIVAIILKKVFFS